MSHYIQYHNYEKLRILPSRDPPFLSGSGHIDTRVKQVNNAYGDKAFLILGIGKPKRTFFLWECFEIESIESEFQIAENGRSVEVFLASGNGWQLIPPAKLEGKEFDEFKEQCANFISFRAIDELPYVKNLIAFSEENHKESYNENLEQFCTTLISLSNYDGEALYYRGVVRQYLGRFSQAIEDFCEAEKQLTSLLEYISQNIPVVERDPELVDRCRMYQNNSRKKLQECRQSLAIKKSSK